MLKALRFLYSSIKYGLVGFASLIVAIVFIPNLDTKLGLYFNFTDSMPIGIYKESGNLKDFNDFNNDINYLNLSNPKDKDRYLLGKLVILCTNELSEMFVRKQTEGFCTNQRMPLLKRVIAVNGDVISINENGVFVNGIYQNLSKPLTEGINNEPLPKLNIDKRQLTKNEIIVLGNSSTSWDSRYWGIADSSQVIAVVKPLLTL